MEILISQEKMEAVDEWMRHILHGDPHKVLGIHPYGPHGRKVIRLWRPGASQVYLEVYGEVVAASRVHSSSFFTYVMPAGANYCDYRIYHSNGMLAYDPYSFWPTFGEVDEYLFSNGTHYQLYDVMGARLIVHQGCAGVKFTVWAPAAEGLALVGDFNQWDGRVNPMRRMGISGVWELFVPGLEVGEKYKFEVRAKSGRICVKADPYALAAELRPATASIVANANTCHWTDHQWLEERKKRSVQNGPMIIYEVHLGSWKKSEGNFLNYRVLAHQLADYCRNMGFTHVELMSVAEHPLDESWGYQVTGYYAVTSRYGTLEDFQYFVDTLHAHGIGVLLDWVPGHFPTDDFGLGCFDGTHLYEHLDPRQGWHPHWNTYIFNYGRKEVSNFLIANALFWFEKMHIDGLRVDAVASMLYLDYGREPGEWIPNAHGGNENEQAIEFLKHLNSIVHERYPGVLMIAEESTSFFGVSHPLEQSGLGFDCKWNMGWMNDTLRYFHKDPIYRSHHQNILTFGLLYAFSERFISVLSHDEVVHGKGSLLSKMPGDVWQKFANLRLLYSYMICHPGKKLLFMGGELGQWNEWNCKAEVEWLLLTFPVHSGIQRLVQEINHFYLNHPALWERDFDPAGFEWIDFADHSNSVVSYRRKGSKEEVICVHNFTPSYHSHYVIKLPGISMIQEVFNSDHERYGGSGKINETCDIVKDSHGQRHGFSCALAPLATHIFTVKYDR